MAEYGTSTYQSKRAAESITQPEHHTDDSASSLDPPDHDIQPISRGPTFKLERRPTSQADDGQSNLNDTLQKPPLPERAATSDSRSHSRTFSRSYFSSHSKANRDSRSHRSQISATGPEKETQEDAVTKEKLRTTTRGYRKIDEKPDSRLGRGEKACRKLEKEISDLVQENQRLEQQLEDQDSQIRTVQDRHLERVEVEGFLHAEDDGRIRQEIQTLMSRWSSWAKHYALRSLEEINEEDRSNAHYMSLQIPDELRSSKYASIAPSIVLHSALARFVTALIFRKPFLCLTSPFHDPEETANWPYNASDVFDSEYKRMLRANDDPSLAHKWRSMTLRLFDPSEQESASRFKLYKESVQTKDEYYDLATDIFHDEYGFLYRQTDRNESERELYQIFCSAGKLFSSLWKQKIFIDSQFDCYNQRPFEVASDLMEIHPTQRIDDGDTSKDGLLVQLVVQPAVLAFGTEEGQKYNKFKIWAKAVVWVGSP